MGGSLALNDNSKMTRASVMTNKLPAHAKKIEFET